MSQGSESDRSLVESNAQDTPANSPKSSPPHFPPAIDDWHFVYEENRPVTVENPDEVSTIAFSLDYSSDSAYEHQWPEEFGSDENHADEEESEAVRQFRVDHMCHGCGFLPPSSVALVLDENWGTDGICGRINGDLWFACSSCRPTSFWHQECIGEGRVVQHYRFLCHVCDQLADRDSSTSTTAHTFSVTNADMYDYIPSDLELLKRSHQLGSAGMLLFNSAPLFYHVLYPYWQCALERACVAPSLDQGRCWGRIIRDWTKFGDCHRYDQTLINILLNNYYNSSLIDVEYKVQPFFELRSDVNADRVPKKCFAVKDRNYLSMNEPMN